ncbi:hypothetical protein [Acidovorax sp.]|uniref:hypothetical protein n=1 Tax=Acidovorax sp. TaxID=1872122 RepID=UPI002ACE7711|nr:hypothetical protein [Acidovorax sp.]MDZ7862658.1 hypothetical protein [Acidovorax sp.]
MSAQYRLILIAVLICAAIFGVKAWEGHLIAKGDTQGAARVQADWDRQEAERSAATAADNVLKFRNAERVAHETAQRETERQAHAAGAAAAVRSLRDQLARLDARRDPYPAGDAGLAACAREATTARQLFSESAAAYQGLAAEADGLRDQVGGLQQFVHQVIGAPTLQGAAIER